MTETIIVEESSESVDKPSKFARAKKFLSVPAHKLAAAGVGLALVGGTIAAVLILGKDNSDFEGEEPVESIGSFDVPETEEV